MALRNILRDDDPGLTKKSREVTQFNDRLHILLDDMRETLIHANGLGLAAPQVGVLRKVALIVDVPPVIESEDDEDMQQETDSDFRDVLEQANDNAKQQETDKKSQEDSEDDLEEDIEPPPPVFIELINPEIITEEGEQTGSEGCLSLPGVYCIVRRPQTVIFKAQDRYGEEFRMEVSGIMARAVCHETDHLNGVIFTSKADRMLTKEELDEMHGK